MSMSNVGAGPKATTQPLKGSVVAALATAAATPEKPQPAKDARAVKTQTERFDMAPAVDIQEIVLPRDVAGNTGMNATSTGGSSGGRRADAGDALPSLGEVADNSTMSSTSTAPSPQPRPRPAPGGGVKAQAAAQA